VKSYQGKIDKEELVVQKVTTAAFYPAGIGKGYYINSLDPDLCHVTYPGTSELDIFSHFCEVYYPDFQESF
jgi:hypothetical protein